MAHPDITMVKNGIHNPSNPKHFMRLKPCARRVRIWRGDLLLVDTVNATRLMEVGGDLYDPMFYIRPQDVKGQLNQIPDKSTHCPLKGDASYYLLEDDTIPEGSYFAWSYDDPFDFASDLNGLIAFNPDLVRIEEVGG